MTYFCSWGTILDFEASRGFLEIFFLLRMIAATTPRKHYTPPVWRKAPNTEFFVRSAFGVSNFLSCSKVLHVFIWSMGPPTVYLMGPTRPPTIYIHGTGPMITVDCCHLFYAWLSWMVNIGISNHTYIYYVGLYGRDMLILYISYINISIKYIFCVMVNYKKTLGQCIEIILNA